MGLEYLPLTILIQLPAVKLSNFLYLSLMAFCLLRLNFPAFSQDIQVSGTIKDASTGEKLSGATIYLLENKQGITSNEYGFYSLRIPVKDTLTLILSYVGYHTIQKKLFLERSQTIDFNLTPGVDLHEIEITANSIVPIEKRTEMSVLHIPMQQIKMLPALGGEPDILKAFQLMPGVKQGNEGSSALLVRGGSQEQNLIIIDDIPLYYVNHLGGFVSIFNYNALKDATLYKGGFPARYGGRLSSVLNVQMKEGNAVKTGGNVQIGLLNASFMVEGPIKKNKTSYLISFRRFLYDLLTRPITSITFNNVSAGYYFYDVNAKINHKLGDKDWLYLSFYGGNDKVFVNAKDKSDNLKYKTQSSTQWGNIALGLRWNHHFNNRFFGNITTAFTQYRYVGKVNSQIKKTNINEENQYKFYSGIRDFSTKADFEFYLNNNFKIFFGVGSVFHNFKPGVTSFSSSKNSLNADTLIGNYKTRSLENDIYFENIINITRNVNTNIGFRLTQYYENGKNYIIPEPRILVNFRITNNSSLKASYSLMSQPVHLLTNDGTGMPSDLWMPSTSNVKPEESQQVALGFAKTTRNKLIEISVEAYYKKMKNLIAYKAGLNYQNLSENWENKIEKDGIGTSYGIEILAQKVLGKTTGWIGYTLSKSDRQFSNLNYGKVYPYKYDRRHEINIVVTHKIKDNIELSITWTYATGNAITLATGKYRLYSYDEFFPPEVPTYDQEYEILKFREKNAYRMRAFHKLDIGANFRKKKKNGVRTWSVSIYNVYNRQNPYYYYYERVPSQNYSTQSNKLVLKQLSLFPFIPSFSYSFSF